MAGWNQYINDMYYPENTSADAPEKILYFFIRDALCENSNSYEFDAKCNTWNNLFSKINCDAKYVQSFDHFKNYYLINLKGGKGDPLPVPFHTDIPCTFKVMYSSGKEMENKGFGQRFLYTFFWSKDEINYDLIKKLWDILTDKKELNYYESLIIKSLEESNYKESNYKLKSKEVMEYEILKYKLNEFKCKCQPEQFQKDLSFILKLNLSRVEKINWIQNLIYFHFSSYMMRIFYVMGFEERNFLSEDVDLCSNCKGLSTCKYKGVIITKSSISANNTKEAIQIRAEYKELVSNILIKGYYRFIAFNQLRDIYHHLKSEWPTNLKEISEYYKQNSRAFLDCIKNKLKSYDDLMEKVDIDNYSFEVETNIFSTIYEIYKYYYEISGKNSADLTTRQMYNLLAGDKGCNYLKTVRDGRNYYVLSSEFLSFIANIIIGANKEQMLIDDFWEEMKSRGFNYASQREKDNIENQLSLMGHLDRKSDAGESQYIKKTV